MRLKSIFIQTIIGILIIVIIFFKLNITDIAFALKKTNHLYFILACISYLCMNLVLSTRMRLLLTRIGYQVKFTPVFLSHIGGMFAGDITPGRSGYFLTPALLNKKTGSKITDGMACIFAPQGIEFILKVGGAVAALYYMSKLSDISGNLLILVSISAILLLAVGILMLIISWHNEKVSLKFIRKLPFFKKFTENIPFFKERSIQIKGSINAILILYMIGWFFAGLQWFYLGRALGIQLSFFTFFLLHPLITLLMFVPGLPAGLGLMEAGSILVFSLLGVPYATAAAFSILVRISVLLVDAIGLKTVMSSLHYSDFFT
jgi:uncharacterized protein (TIRG00374 family)